MLYLNDTFFFDVSLSMMYFTTSLTALNYFNCEICHNFVNFNSDCSAYEVHEFVLKCYSSDYISLIYDAPTVYLLNGGFVVE